MKSLTMEIIEEMVERIIFSIGIISLAVIGTLLIWL